MRVMGGSSVGVRMSVWVRVKARVRIWVNVKVRVKIPTRLHQAGARL